MNSTNVAHRKSCDNCFHEMFQLVRSQGVIIIKVDEIWKENYQYVLIIIHMNSSNYKREKKTTTKIWNKIYEKKKNTEK